MYCIRCRDRVRYDRAVVRESDGRTIAGLCDACEREHLGRVLLDGYVDGGGDCAFCSRSGAVALPVHRIELHEVGGRTETRGFPVDADTPRLGGDHAERVLDGDATAHGFDGPAAEPTAVADGGRDERRGAGRPCDGGPSARERND